ncbi:MAG: T9SS type A sorting domain-containing protein [Bacteroidales bacterium]|nr:T9SS type A sorting domain-containing protein [Bacteroidales bacterium]
MKKTSYLIIAISFVFLVLLSFSDFNQQERLKYETFLIEKFEEANITGPDGEYGEIKQDRPDLAFFQNYIMTLDPKTGTVPSDRLKKAFLRMEELERQKSAFTDEINFVWDELKADMGGRTRTIVSDPSSEGGKKVWAGSVTGGLWYNEDVTSVLSPWLPVNDFMDNLSISSIAFDPNNVDVMYAGTGESQTATKMYRESSGLGNGVMKSEDGGKTWNWTNGNFAYISDIVLRDENGLSVIYAAAVSGDYKGENHVSRPSDGLYRSEDGGLSWQQVLPLIPGGKDPYAPSDIEMGPNGKLYVGTQRNLENNGAAVILCSDDGLTWSVFSDIQLEIEMSSNPARNIPGRIILTASQSDSNIVYAVVASGGYSNEGFLKDIAYTILRSNDGGISWAKTSMPAGDGSWARLAWHALVIQVDPSNPEVVYAGGLDVHKSTDGGDSWQRISDWKGMYAGYGDRSYVHADQHKILFLDGSSSHIVFATDGGVFYSSDGTEEYPQTAERNKAFNTLQYYTCDIHPEEDKQFFIAGTQDNGTMRYLDYPVSVSDMVSGGDGAYCFFDQDEPGTFITSVYNNQYYVFKTNVNDETYLFGNIDDYYSGTFINPADFDSRLNILYANATTFTLDHRDELLVIKDATQNPGGTFLPLSTGTGVPFSHVRVSEFSPLSSSTLFLGTQSGELFKVKHAEAFPVTENITGSEFPSSNISCVDLGNSEEEIILSFSNYGVESVWESQDGGSSWRNVEGDLPDMPVRWIMYHPSYSRKAIAATELGIWVADDLDEQDIHWRPANDGLANVRIDMIKYRESDQTFLIASHGRGLFSTSNTGTLNRPPDAVRNKDLMIYPNPNNGNFRLDLKQIKAKDVSINSVDGKIVYHKVLNGKTGGGDLHFDLKGIVSGVYFVRVRADNQVYESKFIVK